MAKPSWRPTAGSLSQSVGGRRMRWRGWKVGANCVHARLHAPVACARPPASDTQNGGRCSVPPFPTTARGAPHLGYTVGHKLIAARASFHRARLGLKMTSWLHRHPVIALALVWCMLLLLVAWGAP